MQKKFGLQANVFVGASVILAGALLLALISMPTTASAASSNSAKNAPGLGEEIRATVKEKVDAKKDEICDRFSDRVQSRFPWIKGPSFCRDVSEPTLPTVSLSANPMTVMVGATSTLTWSSSDATSCTASGGWSGSKGLSGSEGTLVSATTTYTLACANTNGTTTSSVTVNATPVPPLPSPVTTLNASPLSLPVGSSTLLTWSSSNATVCLASGGWSGAKALASSESVVVNATTTYTLACGNGMATDTESVIVNAIPVVVPAPTATINASPLSVLVGATSTLTWSSANASLCTASDGWSGAKALSGSEIVTVNATTTYTISCGNGTATSSASTTVNASPVPLPTPELTFNAVPTTINQGATSTLSWSSVNTTACTASNGWSGAQATAGAFVVTPSATTTYVLSCSGVGGIVIGTTTVNVIPTSIPTVALNADFLAIVAGATSTLAWSTTHAVACTASNGWTGPRSTSGSEIVAPLATTTYVLECSGLGGTASSSVTIGVTPTSTPVQNIGHVVISEVYYDVASTTGTESGNEWIELYNGSTTAVDINGWKIQDAGGFFDTLATTSTIIPAGGRLVVTQATSTGDFWSIPSPVIVLLSPIGNGLGNVGDALTLMNQSSTTIDSVEWGTSTTTLMNPSVADVAEGHSIGRIQFTADTDTNADWGDFATPTPGQ